MTTRNISPGPIDKQYLFKTSINSLLQRNPNIEDDILIYTDGQYRKIKLSLLVDKLTEIKQDSFLQQLEDHKNTEDLDHLDNSIQYNNFEECPPSSLLASDSEGNITNIFCSDFGFSLLASNSTEDLLCSLGYRPYNNNILHNGGFKLDSCLNKNTIDDQNDPINFLDSLIPGVETKTYLTNRWLFKSLLSSTTPGELKFGFSNEDREGLEDDDKVLNIDILDKPPTEGLNDYWMLQQSHSCREQCLVAGDYIFTLAYEVLNSAKNILINFSIFNPDSSTQYDTPFIPLTLSGPWKILPLNITLDSEWNDYISENSTWHVNIYFYMQSDRSLSKNYLSNLNEPITIKWDGYRDAELDNRIEDSPDDIIVFEEEDPRIENEDVLDRSRTKVSMSLLGLFYKDKGFGKLNTLEQDALLSKPYVSSTLDDFHNTFKWQTQEFDNNVFSEYQWFPIGPKSYPLSDVILESDFSFTKSDLNREEYSFKMEDNSNIRFAPETFSVTTSDNGNRSLKVNFLFEPHSQYNT